MPSETRVCQNCKTTFAIEDDDFAFYIKMQLPAPTWCPECRFKRRLAWRNGRILFRRKDDASGKDIFSGFPPSAPCKVYDHEYWKTDAWDALTYGRDYDFSKTFFEQYRDLLYSVPWPSKSVQGMVNSDYCDQAGFFKNSYLCFNGDRVEDSAYVVQSTDCKNSLDLLLCLEDQLCYECVAVNGSYRTVFSRDCENCVDVWASKSCIGCFNCFGCVNLRDKSYCIFNEQYSKEEYAAKLKELDLNSRDGLQAALKRAEEFALRFPVKYYHGFRIVGSSGDYLRNVKNVKFGYYIDGAQDCKYIYNTYLDAKDSYDYGPWGNSSSQMYECLTCGDQCNKEKFCFESWPACRNMEYCCFCRSSSDCFGCVSVKKRQYCILNKQYSKEEYEALRAKIIEQMNTMPYRDAKGREYRYGEFFPSELSPFAYNETALNDIYPLSAEAARAEGYVWHDPDVREFETTLTADKLPATIGEVNESILKEIIQCVSCRRAYRIIDTELKYLQQMNLPLPSLCINCRAAARAALMNPPRYYSRSCSCAGVKSKKGKVNSEYKNTAVHAHGEGECPNEFETAYSPDQPEIVYCEACYQSEVN